MLEVYHFLTGLQQLNNGVIFSQKSWIVTSKMTKYGKSHVEISNELKISTKNV
jgi:hypothetical protein